MGQFDNDSNTKIEEELRNNNEYSNNNKNKSPRKNNNNSYVPSVSGVSIGINNGNKRISPRNIPSSTSPTKTYNHLNNNPKYVNVEKRNIYDNRKNNDSLTHKVAIHLKNQEITPYQLENLIREGASTKTKIDTFNGSTLLHCASGFANNFNLNMECFKMLLELASAEDLSICDNHGLNIIHYSIINNKLEILKLISERLSKEKPKVSHKVINEKAITAHNINSGYHHHPNNTSGNYQKDYKAYNHQNRTPLHIAAQTHNEKAIRYLISCHADGNVRDINNQVALELALLSDAPQIIIDLLMGSTKVLKVMKKCLNNFSINDCRNVIYKLAKMGVNFNLRNRKNLTPIMISSQFGDTELLIELIHLAKDGKTEGLEAKDENLHTALHCACSWGHIDCVKILLENGADFEAKDNQSNTPLARASQWGRHEIVEILLAKGANANAISGFNKAPIELAFAKGISNCNSPHWECIELLIPHSDFSRLLFSKSNTNVNDRICFYAR